MPVYPRGRGEPSPPNTALGSQEYNQLASENLQLTVAETAHAGNRKIPVINALREI
jgi:hypothetical protein